MGVLLTIYKLSCVPLLILICQLLMFQDVGVGRNLVFIDFNIEWGTKSYIEYNLAITIAFLILLTLVVPIFGKIKVN